MDSFYKQIISTFNQYQVRYLVVGGFAVNFHGYNRTTGDLDLWVDISDTNLDAISKALNSLEYEFDETPRLELADERMVVFSEGECVVELIPRLNISDKISFDKAYESSDLRVLDDVEYKIISLDHLLKEKARSKRYKDLDDYSKLMEAKAYYGRRSKEE